MRYQEDTKALHVAAIGTFVTVVGVVIIAVIVSAQPSESAPQPPKNCVDLYNQYAAEIAKGPKEREAMLPGADGRSVLDSDPSAKACGITSKDFP